MDKRTKGGRKVDGEGGRGGWTGTNIKNQKATTEFCYQIHIQCHRQQRNFALYP